MGRRFRKKHLERALARRRISRLFELAHRRTLEEDPAHADRSVQLARRIAMRYQTGLTADQRDRTCNGCRGYLAPGVTARIRVQDSAKRTTCLRCGHHHRRPYLAEQKAKRAASAAARRTHQPTPATTPEPSAPTPTP